MIKKPRVSNALLPKHWSACVAGCIVIEDYLAAIRLEQTRDWFHSALEKPWVNFESTLISGGNLCHYMFMDAWRTQKLNTLPPVIYSSLLAWRKLLANSQIKAPISFLHFPIKLMELIIPLFNSQAWIGKGLKNIYDPYSFNKFKSWETLQNKFRES